jgi:hypothetical protein
MLAAIVLFAAVATVPPSFESPEELRDWLTYYYLKPRPELILPSIRLMEEQLHKATGRSLGDQVARGGMRTFYAEVFAQNDLVVDDLGRRFRNFGKGQRAFLLEALRRCPTAACQRVRRQSAPAGSAASAEVGPLTVDDLWAAFAATGKEEYVRQVIGEVVAGKVSPRSLEGNAYQHSRALAVCEKAAAELGGPAREKLQEIVAVAKRHRAENPPAEPEP